MGTTIGIFLMVGITVYLLRKRVNIGLIMLIDSVCIIFIQGMSFDAAVNAFVKGGLSSKTIGLMLIVYLIMMLEMMMRKKGMIQEITDSLKHLLRSNRKAAALLPMVIGMLPSPGGARLSCPMVEEMTGESDGQSIKAFVNFWFRHAWRDGFILYPGLIIAAEIIEVDSLYLCLHIIPFMLIAILIGIFLGVLKIKKEKIEDVPNDKEDVKKFMINFFPILFVIGLYMLLLGLGLRNYGLQIACLATIVILIIWKKYNGVQIREVMKQAFSPKFLFIILGVMVFKEVLFASQILDRLPEMAEKYHISKFLLFIILPYIGGFSTGIMVSAVSIAFPILLPFGLADNIWYGTIAFIAATTGIMTSPLHLCAVMTSDYFSVSLNRVLFRTMLAESLMMLAVIATIFLVS